jgi:hypothetical protein
VFADFSSDNILFVVRPPPKEGLNAGACVCVFRPAVTSGIPEKNYEN